MYSLLFFGIGLVIISINVFMTGNLSNSLYGPVVILGDERYLISALIFIFGLIFLCYTYKSYKHKKIHGKYIEHSICPSCEKSYNYIDLKEGMCPMCDLKTVDIKEYYKDKKDYEK